MISDKPVLTDHFHLMQLLFVAILVASCYSCHGNGASEGRFVDAAESILDSAFPSEVLAAKAVDVKVLRGKADSNGNVFSFNNPPTGTYTFRNSTPSTFRIKVALDVDGLTPEEQSGGVARRQMKLSSHREM